MGYYIRVLGTEDPDIHLDQLLANLSGEGLTAKFALAQGDTPGNWTLLQVANDNNDIIMQVERNPVVDGRLGKKELEEFKEIIEDFKPDTAVAWLREYLDNIKVIYAFQLLNAAFNDNDYPIVSSIRTKIWNKTGGILQADNEGFSNEDGYHILWQFYDDVTGLWNCAVLDASGNWQQFEMDLGDKTQREEFMNGKVPASAKQAE